MYSPVYKFITENPWIVFVFAFFVLFEAVLKYISLWRSARNSQLGWFIVLCILNTLGILPLIYLIWFSTKKVEGTTAS